MDSALYAPAAFHADAYDEQPRLTQTQRVIDVFTRPTATFADIRRNRSWWLPFLILSVFSYLFTMTALSRVGVDRIAENSVRNNPAQSERMQQSTPEQKQRTLGMIATSMKFSFYSWPVLLLLLSAISALLLWAGFNFVLGGTGTYAGMFAVVLFAWLPSIVRSLLATGMLFLADAESFNINDPVGTNPGFYLGPEAPAFLKSALGSIDIFSLWTLALMAVGGAIVSRVRIRNGVVMVFAVWLIYVLGKAAIVAATA